MQENYLAKWLNNELSEEELAAFKKSAEYASYQRILEASNKLEAPEFNAEQAWASLKERTSKEETKVVPLRPFKQFLRVAAVVAVMLAGSYFYLNSLDESFSTDLAERTEIMLPDNSEVVLNADSKVSFSEKKWNKERKVSLEGEAFFKVAKGKKFTVSTENGYVTVLGTQFNVENRNGFFEVTCYEGLVSVSYQNIEKKLPAGTSFAAIDGKVQNSDKVATVKPSWMANESTFKSIPLKYVLAEFERQFDVEVNTENVDTEQLFTGTFSNTDINLALESISAPSQIRYTLGNDNVLFYAENAP
ncbi:FecR family protein [Allomuricauda sp. d1]|uniref:FecR family protein n=1 Tax=Allomuricauda sp. d1 TaxID=3136725 RepID=UPI0031D51D61